MGSDFSNRDISKSTDLLDEYHHTLLTTVQEEDHIVYTIEAVPREHAAVVWGREVLRIRDDWVMLEHQFRDQEDILVKRMRALAIKEVDGRAVASRLRMASEEESGHWTELLTEEVDFNVDLPPHLVDAGRDDLLQRAAGVAVPRDAPVPIPAGGGDARGMKNGRIAVICTLAWRNLWRNRRRTGIMLAAVVVGVWSMVFMTAMTRGMVDQSIENSLEVLPGEVQIHHPAFRRDPSVVNSIASPSDGLLEALNRPPIEAWVACVRVPAVVASERDSRGVTLLGVEPDAERAGGRARAHRAGPLPAGGGGRWRGDWRRPGAAPADGAGPAHRYHVPGSAEQYRRVGHADRRCLRGAPAGQ